jgi:hypothetical protein
MSTLVSLVNKDSGAVLLAEARNISLKHSLSVLYRPFNTGRLETISLTFNSQTNVYENDTYTISADEVYAVVAPNKVVRVRRPRGYSMGASTCKTCL